MKKRAISSLLVLALIAPALAQRLGAANEARREMRQQRRMERQNGRSLLVGDSETDVLTARAAGVPIIGVTFGYTARPVAEFKPDALIGQFNDAFEPIMAMLDGDRAALSGMDPPQRDQAPPIS